MPGVLPSMAVLLLAAYETSKISVPTIVDSLLGGADPRTCDRRLDSWSRQLLRQAKVQINARGLELIEPGQSYIVMSNHQSLYDIPVLFQALGIPVRMVAKKELFRIPVMGGGMRGSGFVELDRSNRHKAVRSLNAAKERLLADKTSLWIAPEGTRTLDGSMGEFKRGGFHLALESGLHILPVTIDGTRLVHPADSYVVTKGLTVTVTVSPSINPSDYGKEGVRALMAEVRSRIARHLPEPVQQASS